MRGGSRAMPIHPFTDSPTHRFALASASAAATAARTAARTASSLRTEERVVIVVLARRCRRAGINDDVRDDFSPFTNFWIGIEHFDVRAVRDAEAQSHLLQLLVLIQPGLATRFLDWQRPKQ